MVYQIKSLAGAITFMILAMNAAAQPTGKFKDSRDGKTYKTVKIGKQTWMAQDLNYHPSGPVVADFSQKATIGSWCYGNDSSNCDKQGRRLYTAISAAQCCPAGWHLPSADEWMEMIDYLGGPFVAGGKLKAKKGWDASDSAATNSSGFSAEPGGFRNYGGVFGGAGKEGYWLSSTSLGGRGVWYFSLRYDDNVINRYGSNHKEGAYSVRCVKNLSDTK